MSDEIFNKILSNTATETEKVDFFRLLESDNEKREEYLRYKNLYAVSSLNDKAYQKVREESFSKFWGKTSANRPQNLTIFWAKYAAIFILASSLGFLANYLLTNTKTIIADNHIEYSSEKGSVSTIKLNDGSSIWLSSGTKLVIDKNKNGETVAKLNGEAYFDLVPNPERKFVVDLGLFKIKDIGTTFNVRAYESEKLVSTTLVNGRVDLIKETGESFLTVKPGDYAQYDKNNSEVTVGQKDPSLITAWKDGKFVFIDQPLSEICKELERWYNIEIQIEDPSLANTRYNTIVKRTTTVEMVLSALSITDQINYKITDKKEGKDIIQIRK